MHIKISSPESLLFEGDIKKVSLPGEKGDIIFGENSNPAVSVLNPGIIKIRQDHIEGKHNLGKFVYENDHINISVSKGMIFTDGKMINVVTSSANTQPIDSEKRLIEMKVELEAKIKKLKIDGNIEDIERSMIKLEKIGADIKLAKLKSNHLVTK